MLSVGRKNDYIIVWVHFGKFQKFALNLPNIEKTESYDGETLQNWAEN